MILRLSGVMNSRERGSEEQCDMERSISEAGAGHLFRTFFCETAPFMHLMQNLLRRHLLRSHSYAAILTQRGLTQREPAKS